MSEPFDASLPPPYAGNWKQAERSSADDSPRLTSFQAPGGDAIVFILKSFEFSGGQSVDTAEYPFDGLWSNEALNEKPQSLTIEGFIRGPKYIQTRNALIEALRIKTDDETPGFIDFPFWGRFPIVVVDYKVSENTDEKGQSVVNLVFRRAGVSITEREIVLSNTTTAVAVETAAANLETAAITSFEKTIADRVNTNAAAAPEINIPDTNNANMLAQAFGKIKSTLLTALGRVRAAQTLLNNITGEINGISSLLAEGIRTPGELARSLFNASASIVGGLAEIKNSVESYAPSGGSSSAGSPYPAPVSNNEKKVLMQFLSASGYTLDIIPLTVRQESAKRAIENLYRTCALGATCQIMARNDYSYQKTSGYWRLLRKLEDSIDKDDPAVYAAVEEMRIAVSRRLSVRELSAEQKRYFNMPLPLLYMAHYLGCGEAKLRELNSIADSFVIQGNVVYV